VCDRLEQAQTRYKLQYDRNHRDLEFQVKEWAWFHLLHRPITSLQACPRAGSPGMSHAEIVQGQPSHVCHNLSNPAYQDFFVATRQAASRDLDRLQSCPAMAYRGQNTRSVRWLPIVLLGQSNVVNIMKLTPLGSCSLYAIVPTRSMTWNGP
jgi:hypothetical protein